MAAYKEYYDEGKKLMEEALKAYDNGNYPLGDELREQANIYYNKAERISNTEEGKINMLYGEGKNFGIAYNIFEQNIVNLLKKKNGKKIIKEFYNTIKNNKVLNEQFKIYDAIENSQAEISDTKNFVEEACSSIGRFNKKQLAENNMKLIGLIRKYKLNEYVDIPTETEDLYEAIETLMLNKNNFSSIEKRVKSKEIIREYLERNNVKKVETPTIDDIKSDVEKMEESIEKDFDEEEKMLIEKYLSPDTNREKFFNEQKRKTLSKINEARNSCNNEDRKQWDNIYERVMNKSFNEKDGLSMCAEMIEIYNTI